ncbi:putative gustatory receptor 28b [Trichogramma pretiosum]|uniref:putative gustatory receptor 28b n=1 Tax=Trichogramma pretiosum TaxID=7493 RepID=UPI0006C99AFE|nr:putative gustatory receptor 28b [Trichogramma pretiosum]
MITENSSSGVEKKARAKRSSTLLRYPSDLTCLKFLLLIFKSLGLATFSIVESNDKNQSRVDFVDSTSSLVYTLFLLGLIALTNCWGFLSVYNFRYKRTLKLFNAIDLLEVFAGIVNSLAIGLFYCWNQTRSAGLAARIYRLKLSGDSLRDRDRNSPLDAVLLVGFELLLFLALLVTCVVFYDRMLYTISSTLRNLVVAWLFLQYALVVRSLLGVAARINSALRALPPRISSGTSCCSVLVNAKCLQALLRLRRMHCSLVETYHEVAKFYSLVVLGSVMYAFLCFVVILYFLMNLLLERRLMLSAIEYVQLLLRFVGLMSSLVALLIYVTKIGEEFDQTGILVHRLIQKTLNKDVLTELNDFSLYLLHARTNFTAYGFFTLDGSLIISIFGSIATYLVILVQFQLEFRSDEAR